MHREERIKIILVYPTTHAFHIRCYKRRYQKVRRTAVVAISYFEPVIRSHDVASNGT